VCVGVKQPFFPSFFPQLGSTHLNNLVAVEVVAAAAEEEEEEVLLSLLLLLLSLCSASS
jgi:hypothetical protein